MAPGSTLYFGPFSLDGTDDGLWCGPERRHLTAKAEAVLRYLVAHPGCLVRKADLPGGCLAERACQRLGAHHLYP